MTVPTKPLLLPLAALPFLVGGFLIIRHFNQKGWASPHRAGSSHGAGAVTTVYREVPVRSNGPDYTVSHGKHYANDGYYYGQKWQCVEFIKRFYYDAFGHRMPDVWGHARDFFDSDVPNGALNPARGMLQYENGGTTAPLPDDLLVFNASGFGHVAVITSVRLHEIEVVQQNVRGRPRAIHPLTRKDGFFIIGTDRKPAGWLRIPTQKTVESPPTPPREPAP